MSTILAVASAILGPIVEGFKRYQERKQAEHDVIIAQEHARQIIAQETIRAELERGHAQLKATGRRFKYFTFAMWFGPFLISYVAPEYGVKIFENLNQLPEWYVQSCMAIMFSVWGIQVSREAIGHIFAGLGEFFNRRQSMTFKRKIFYDALRSSQGTISEHEVKALEKALDALEKEGER